MKLEPLSLSRLHLAELLQFILRLGEDASLMNIDLTMDNTIQNLYNRMQTHIEPYQVGLKQVLAHEQNQRIAQLDNDRDNDVIALRKALAAYKYSRVPELQSAYIALNHLLNQYKGIAWKSYEEETVLLNNLLENIQNSIYIKEVTKLNLTYFVAQLAQANEDFNKLFTQRSTSMGQKITSDMKTLRLDLTDSYQQLAQYIEVMTNVTGNVTPYVNYLKWLNNSRKYYADILAKRINESIKEAK